MKKNTLIILIFVIINGCTINHYHYQCGGINSKEDFKKVAKEFFPKKHKKIEEIKFNCSNK